MLVASALPHMNISAKIKFNLSKIIFLIFILSGILSLFLAFKPEPTKTKSFQVISDQKIEKSMHSFPKPSPAQTPIPSAILNPATKPSTSPIPTQQISTPQPTSTPEPTPIIITNQVTVSINSLPNFTVSVNEGSNQCDVLSKSLEQGKIGSLNMKYDKNYETYAVYQINGIGKENSVWWVYTVNGKSPSKGCSHIKASNNDNVEWKYMGSS